VDTDRDRRRGDVLSDFVGTGIVGVAR